MTSCLGLLLGVWISSSSSAQDLAASWVDLLAAVDPRRAAVAGEWRKTAEGLSTNASAAARLSLGKAPAAEYDLRVKFTRQSGVHSVAIFFVAGRGQAGLELDAWGEHLAGIQQIAGKDLRSNGTRRENRALQNGRTYTALVQVRRNSVQAFLDDELIAMHESDGSDLSMLPLWGMSDERSLGIGAYQSATVFHQIEVRAVPGSTASATPLAAARTAAPPAPPMKMQKNANSPTRTSPSATGSSSPAALQRPVPPVSDLAALSDEFDDPQSAARWLRVFEVERSGADQLERFDIGRSQRGWLTLVPYTSSWYQDWRGVLVHKRVSGDFIATTRLRTTNRAGSGAPRRPFSLAGIMVRTPREVTPQTWRPGGENYLFLSHGAADRPGTYQFEVKTTVNSQSQLEIEAAPGAEAEIRVARLGSFFIMLQRSSNRSWRIHRRYQRTDMPAELQVGMTVYTDWPNVERLRPEQHNRTVIRNGNPDLIAAFDYFRFTHPEVPAGLRSRNLADPAQVSDAELLALVGTDH